MSVSFDAEFKSPEESNDPTMKLSKQRVTAAINDESSKVYRVYCDGVFDLFHLGHMRMLEQAKKALGKNGAKTYLIAGVCSDELVHQFKGKTVYSHKLRCESVRHCKWVDEVLPDAPWVLTDDYLERNKIDFVAHDAIPYSDNSGSASDAADVYGHIKAKGMFLETQRTEGLSTSDIIVQLIRDYDDYVIRNLDRGYTKKELNVGKSWAVRKVFHEKEKRLKNYVQDTKQIYSEMKKAWGGFIQEFDPRRNLFSADEEKSKIEFTPKKYVTKIRTNFKQQSQGVLFHSYGLCKALVNTGLTVASYFNPLSYCERKKKKES
jgi:choline-phosphate cytidylyltransferase